jgi:hypothetical protein
VFSHAMTDVRSDYLCVTTLIEDISSGEVCVFNSKSGHVCEWGQVIASVMRSMTSVDSATVVRVPFRVSVIYAHLWSSEPE